MKGRSSDSGLWAVLGVPGSLRSSWIRRWGAGTLKGALRSKAQVPECLGSFALRRRPPGWGPGPGLWGALTRRALILLPLLRPESSPQPKDRRRPPPSPGPGAPGHAPRAPPRSGPRVIRRGTPGKPRGQIRARGRAETLQPFPRAKRLERPSVAHLGI